MNDPYSVLGVSPNASDEEVKKAYRDLARKYHPANYHDNPLADLASEKMKEINEAYDEITKSREQGTSGNSYSGNAYQQQRQSYNTGYQQRSYTGGSNVYAQIRALINANNLAQAEAMLNNMSVHDAEWNYLMGSVCWRKGWMDEASRYFRTASNMEPMNQEYRQAVQYMNQGGQAYRPTGYNMNMTNSDAACNMCGNLLCADCCCEMMGGDLIPCC
ncbi:MAG: DnaJ domain-containing protein [Oscillospiraceae bacterium]|nr:DnaJ domain-containing protein [Oscillospiraceae bacterium]